MTSEEAKEYGMIDEILQKNEQVEIWINVHSAAEPRKKPTFLLPVSKAISVTIVSSRHHSIMNEELGTKKST